MRTVRYVLPMLLVCLAGFGGAALADDECKPLTKPELFSILPTICPTPDGMAMDAQGNIILACPNFADQTQPAVLMKIDPQNRVRLWCVPPAHPDTGVCCPMGLAFGPDGDLYVCDNQGWVKPNNKGRMLRLTVKNNQVVRTVVVADGMSHPNGCQVHKGHLYVTESLMVKEGNEPLISGVYRFKLDDQGIKVQNNLQDKNLLVSFKTLNPDCQYGVDGLVFDSKGNLFVGNFGDATVHKITFDAQGNVASNTIFAKSKCMRSTDGMCVDNDDNIYVADFSNNAICVVSPQGKVRVLARSPDTDGADGGLDQPGEPIVRGNDLIISNFDLVTGPDKVNTKHDWPYTLSIIRLNK